METKNADVQKKARVRLFEAIFTAMDATTLADLVGEKSAELKRSVVEGIAFGLVGEEKKDFYLAWEVWDARKRSGVVERRAGGRRRLFTASIR